MLGGLLGLRGRGVQQALGVRAGAAQQLLGLAAGGLRLALQPAAGLGGQPLGLLTRGGQGLFPLGAGLLQQPAGLLLGAGAQLLRPRHVLVDVRLDGLAALGKLLVELLAPGHGLLVQLRLEAGGLLGVLLEDALGLGAGLAQLPLGVRAELVGLHLRVAQQLLGLVADVAAFVGGPGHDGAPRLVQLGAQHLDLVAEVLGVLDRLFPLGLQPLHLGFEPREVVDVSRRLSLLALVAPHCAVPSVPWSQVWPSPAHPERGPGEWCQINGGAWADAPRSPPATRPRRSRRRTRRDSVTTLRAATRPNPTGPYVRGSVLGRLNRRGSDQFCQYAVAVLRVQEGDP